MLVALALQQNAELTVTRSLSNAQTARAYGAGARQPDPRRRGKLSARSRPRRYLRPQRKRKNINEADRPKTNFWRRWRMSFATHSPDPQRHRDLI